MKAGYRNPANGYGRGNRRNVCRYIYRGVGLHNGYGEAQRMYAKRGSIPDGSGVLYGDRSADPYGTVVNDDSLVLCLSRKLHD